MRIGIDARAWHWTGIGRYARNLVRELVLRLGPGDTLVVFGPPSAAADLTLFPRTTFVPVRDSYYSLYEQTGLAARLAGSRLDLLHFLNFNVPVLYRRPYVVTIHDLTRFQFPGQRRQGRLHQWGYEWVFANAVRRARHVLTVSQTAAGELRRTFPEVAGRVSVVTEGVDPLFSADAVPEDESRLARLGVRPPYLLYVGLWMRHKNLPGLIRAFRLLRRDGFRGVLVVTGTGRAWDEDVQALAQVEGVREALVLPGHVADADLAALYRHASAFIFPSFAEGFGLPPLEAMASGTPVVAARSGSLPEILGDAAIFADPQNPSQIADAVHLVLADPDLRARLRLHGLARAKRYSWGAAAEATLRVYRQVLGVLPVRQRAAVRAAP